MKQYGILTIHCNHTWLLGTEQEWECLNNAGDNFFSHKIQVKRLDWYSSSRS